MPQTISDILSDATFYTDDQSYRFLKLPPNAITVAAGIVAEVGEPFCALLVDKDEITMMIPAEAADDFAERMPGHEFGETYRLITVIAVLEPDLIGFLAALSAELAAANVGFFPFAAYTTDHVFVPEAQFDTAMATLKNWQQSVLNS